VIDPIHIARWGTSVTTPNLATTIRSRYADVHVATHTLDLRVAHPELWSTTNPALYTVETDVVRGRATVDHASTSFGIRWLAFDPDKGVFLNGRPLKLHGVDLHNDEGALGSSDNYWGS
jgi:beta-galactosidase